MQAIRGLISKKPNEESESKDRVLEKVCYKSLLHIPWVPAEVTDMRGPRGLFEAAEQKDVAQGQMRLLEIRCWPCGTER